MGRVANVPHPDWKPIDTNLLGELQRRSAARVVTNEEFTKINQKLAKRAQEDDVIHLSEFIKEREEEEAETAKDEAKPAAEATAPGKPSAADASKAGASAQDAKTAKPAADHKTSAENEKPKPTPQREEALRILGDLVELEQTDPATWHAQQSAQPSASLSSQP